MGWLGLVAYLFLCLLNSQTAMALSSALAGPHQIAIVSDGDHEDVVFTHELMKSHHHVHTHGQDQNHIGSEENISLLFEAHQTSHPDHVIHLTEHQEQVSVQAAILKPEPQFLYDITIPMEMTAPVCNFLKTVSIKALPQPPPQRPSQLVSLRTIILLI